MERLSHFMAKEDQTWFTQLIDLKIEDQKHVEPEDFLSFNFANRYGKGAKKVAQEKLAQGIIDTAKISFAVDCKQILTQYKLVGFNGGVKSFSFSVQDLLKK